MRVTLHVRHQLGGNKLAQLVLLPVRDALSLGLWAFGFATRRVRWLDALYQVSRIGTLPRRGMTTLWSHGPLSARSNRHR
jgi:hypothetical protein